MIEQAVDDALKTGATTEPTLKAIFLAESINKRNNGPVIAPWDVFELEDDWLEAYRALATVGKRREHQQKMEGFFRDFRRKHPTYRKYRH